MHRQVKFQQSVRIRRHSPAASHLVWMHKHYVIAKPGIEKLPVINRCYGIVCN